MPTTDIVHLHEEQWYFWNEGFVERIGPYFSEHEARQALIIYMHDHLGYTR